MVRAGDDVIVGGSGTDVLYGDDVFGGGGTDSVVFGEDRLYGGTGDDSLFGDFAEDPIETTHGGDDFLNCGPGIDSADGGPGFDIATGCETTVGVERIVQWEGGDFDG